MKLSDFTPGKFSSKTLLFSSRLCHWLTTTVNDDDTAHDPRSYLDEKITAYYPDGYLDVSYVETHGAAVAIVKFAACNVIVYRGPDELRDWFLNLDRNCDTPLLGNVYNGFYDTHSKLFDVIFEHILKSKYTPVFITGHGFGAALATILAAELLDNVNIHLIGVYTFGQPCIGNFKFKHLYTKQIRGRHFRIVNSQDIVTKFPPRIHPFLHVGRAYYFDATGAFRRGIPLRQHLRDLTTNWSSERLRGQWNTDDDSDMTSYRTWVEALYR